MARLASGVRKRQDGSLEKRFTIDGRRYSVYAPNNKELVEKEQALRESITAGLYKTNSNICLDDYFKELIERKKTENKENSLKTYRSIYMNHLSARIGKSKVRELERRRIIDLQQEIAKEYTATTCNYILAILRIILNEAVKDEIISRNPANNIKNVKAEKKASESYHRALTEEEQALFMQESKTSYYYELFALALCTGMRLGELGALSWGDIDNKNNVIHISKTLTYNLDNKVVSGSPKTEAGKRDIPITPAIKQVLKLQREKMGNIYDIDMKNSKIFISTSGTQIYNRTINDEITKILQRLKKQGHDIEHFTAHAFRDTFATRYIEQGGTMQTLKKLLGHSSIKMTMDLYAHVLPDTMQDEMNKIVINI